jgi:hypothetical protein
MKRKEIYEAPELELKKLIPEKNLALLEVGGKQEDTFVSDSDIELPL